MVLERTPIRVVEIREAAEVDETTRDALRRSLRSAQPWLTPFGSVRNLLSGEMSVLRWVQWLCVLLIWGVGLNALGAAVLHRGDDATTR
ncbi:hypothetical protein [Micromonospora sp. NPDC050276]|uniref:hypothetical protein n=1 Tax=Micromonospora sp. NPDC050276 TaxID=3364278 RepID=UPI0037A6D147